MHLNSQIYPLTPFIPLKLSTCKVRVIQGNYIVNLNRYIYNYIYTYLVYKQHLQTIHYVYIYISNDTCIL